MISNANKLVKVDFTKKFSKSRNPMDSLQQWLILVNVGYFIINQADPCLRNTVIDKDCYRLKTMNYLTYPWFFVHSLSSR